VTESIPPPYEPISTTTALEYVHILELFLASNPPEIPGDLRRRLVAISEKVKSIQDTEQQPPPPPSSS
jgi:hypothetical protein